MKIVFSLLFLLMGWCLHTQAQVKDSVRKKKDTVASQSIQNKKKPTDSSNKKRKDTLHLRDTAHLKTVPDSNKNNSGIIPSNDSTFQQIVKTAPPKNDTLASNINLSPSGGKPTLTKVLSRQRFFNANQPSEFVLHQERFAKGKEIIFYTLCGLLLILGIFKTLYKNYFNNLFRIFFNTSLRQSQLTEQLMQAQWPSFFLNIFFFISASLYLSLLWQHYSFSHFSSWEISLLTFFIVIAGIYLIKFLVLKFLGWIAGIQSFTNNYIFIIFLINKVAGLLLLPFIIFLSFTHASALKTVFTISFLLLIFLVLIRYLKSFSTLDRKLTVSRFHFLLYVLGGEVLPVLILYKIAVDYLGYA